MQDYLLVVYTKEIGQLYLNQKTNINLSEFTLHREDGPAVVTKSGYKAWFLDNKEYTEEDYWNTINSMEQLQEKCDICKDIVYKGVV